MSSNRGDAPPTLMLSQGSTDEEEEEEVVSPHVPKRVRFGGANVRFFYKGSSVIDMEKEPAPEPPSLDTSRRTLPSSSNVSRPITIRRFSDDEGVSAAYPPSTAVLTYGSAAPRDSREIFTRDGVVITEISRHPVEEYAATPEQFIAFAQPILALLNRPLANFVWRVKNSPMSVTYVIPFDCERHRVENARYNDKERRLKPTEQGYFPMERICCMETGVGITHKKLAPPDLREKV